eukprot:jgi/Mesvir1/8725/Mv25013-RA.1
MADGRKRKLAEVVGPVAGPVPQLRVADHYSSRKNVSKEEREKSPIFGLKKLNNWIKSVLIRNYVREQDAVLDFACGKGGDLSKWKVARISFYVGVDIALGSVHDAAERYNEKNDFRFKARLIAADCFEYDLVTHLKDDVPFDICSCQFALHYCFSSEARARRALFNVAFTLRPGGYFIGTMTDADVLVKNLRALPPDCLQFGNRLYNVAFHAAHKDKKFSSENPFNICYTFRLEDAIDDCDEYLVAFDVLVSLAEEYGLVLRLRQNFHSFVWEELPKDENKGLRGLLPMKEGERGGPPRLALSSEEWEAAYLYQVFVFQKVDTKEPTSRRVRESCGYQPIPPDAVEDLITPTVQAVVDLITPTVQTVVAKHKVPVKVESTVGLPVLPRVQARAVVEQARAAGTDREGSPTVSDEATSAQTFSGVDEAVDRPNVVGAEPPVEDQGGDSGGDEVMQDLHGSPGEGGVADDRDAPGLGEPAGDYQSASSEEGPDDPDSPGREEAGDYSPEFEKPGEDQVSPEAVEPLDDECSAEEGMGENCG